MDDLSVMARGALPDIDAIDDGSDHALVAAALRDRAALEGLHQFDSERGSFAAWLFTIASRRVIDRARSRGRSWRAARRSWTHSEAVEDAATTVQRREDARRVHQALSTLPEPDRELVLLRYSAELTSRQIGEIVGISPGSVRMRLSRLLDRLAIELGTDQ